MLNRPFILKLFSIILILNPILRVIFLSIEKEFGIFDVLTRSISLPFYDFFNFWILFPISSIFLLYPNTFTFVFFIIIQIYSLIIHIGYESYSWPYLSKTPSIASLILLFINLITTLYFILSDEMRKIFFDKYIRWWERPSRYTINEPCFVNINSHVIHGILKDLSSDGSLLELESAISDKDKFKIEFDILDINISLNARIIRNITNEGFFRYGIQFQFKNFLEKFKINILIFYITLLKKYDKYR